MELGIAVVYPWTMRDPHRTPSHWLCALAASILSITTASHAAQPSQPSIQFLSRDEARKAIVDESKEAYFSRLQPMEMAAKTGSPVPGATLDEQREECRRRYADAVEDFTPSEKDALTWYVSQLVSATAPYPLFARTPWSFIKVGGGIETGNPVAKDRQHMPAASPIGAVIEGGNPFTRGVHIVLPDAIVSEMVLEKQQAAIKTEGFDPQWLSLARFGSVLLHEQTHVVQREHPEVLARMYTEYWGFSRAAKIDTDPWLIEHQMLDPDAIDQNWVFPIQEVKGTRWIWPLMVIEDAQGPSGPSFKDARQIAVELEPTGQDAFKVKVAPSGRLVERGLMNEVRYMSRLSPSRSPYHPNEASADLFARVIIAENLPGHPPDEAKDALEKAKVLFKPLQEWFAKIFAAQ
jgi:hypothetical protein